MDFLEVDVRHFEQQLKSALKVYRDQRIRVSILRWETLELCPIAFKRQSYLTAPQWGQESRMQGPPRGESAAFSGGHRQSPLWHCFGQWLLVVRYRNGKWTVIVK
jgi:hypothetical protein